MCWDLNKGKPIVSQYLVVLFLKFSLATQIREAVKKRVVKLTVILMSKYKGQHGGKKGKKIGQGPPPPFTGNARKKSIFLM